MTTDKSNGINAAGASIIGSAISGSGTAVSAGTTIVGSAQAGPTVPELRSQLIARQDDIVACGRDEAERDGLRYDVGKIVQELEKIEPGRDVVRGRWASVRDVVSKVVGTTDIGKITDMITAIFGP
jgi:hypothetical protein